MMKTQPTNSLRDRLYSQDFSNSVFVIYSELHCQSSQGSDLLKSNIKQMIKVHTKCTTPKTCSVQLCYILVHLDITIRLRKIVVVPWHKLCVHTFCREHVLGVVHLACTLICLFYIWFEHVWSLRWLKMPLWVNDKYRIAKISQRAEREGGCQTIAWQIYFIRQRRGDAEMEPDLTMGKYQITTLRLWWTMTALLVIAIGTVFDFPQEVVENN